MYSSKRFRLIEATLGIETVNENHVAVSIPAGETIVVLSGPKPYDVRMVDVQWRGRTFVMFFEDIRARGIELQRTKTPSAYRQSASM